MLTSTPPLAVRRRTPSVYTASIWLKHLHKFGILYSLLRPPPSDILVKRWMSAPTEK